MINTVNSADDHWTKGVFTIGSGPEVILVSGACRVVPYANYLDYLNANNRFTIHLMNVVNYSWPNGVQCDGAEYVKKYEQDAQFLAMLKSVKWFMHEHIANYGMMNNDRARPKNIYQFGMKPELDIALPNFNNVYPMFQELVTFDAPLRAMAVNDMPSGRLSKETQHAISARGQSEILKFISLCWMSSLPEMAELFENTWRTVRYFWSGNHVSNVFTMTVFRMMNDKFLKLKTDDAFWNRISKEDLFENPKTPVTEYDVQYYGLKWNVPIQALTL